LRGRRGGGAERAIGRAASLISSSGGQWHGGGEFDHQRAAVVRFARPAKNVVAICVGGGLVGGEGGVCACIREGGPDRHLHQQMALTPIIGEGRARQ